MPLNEHLDDIRNGLIGEQYENEASVIQGIVLRLLHVLGWPRYNTQIIIPEYSVEGRRVDLALCHPPSEPLVFIEVKAVGQIAGAERQLFEYAFHRGVPIAILTDGRVWHFFRPGGQGDYNERRVYKLDLTETDNQESSGRFNRYLNYELIRTGEAITAIETDYQDISRQRRIEISLPKAWATLLEEVDEFLIDVIAEKTENLCGYRPPAEQVLDFLSSLELRSPEREATQPREVSPPLIRQNSPTPRRRRARTRLDVTMPNGERIAHQTAIAAFAEVIENIGIDRVRSVFPDLISTSKSPQHGYQIGRYYIKDQTSTEAKKQILERVASRLGIYLRIEIVS